MACAFLMWTPSSLAGKLPFAHEEEGAWLAHCLRCHPPWKPGRLLWPSHLSLVLIQITSCYLLLVDALPFIPTAPGLDPHGTLFPVSLSSLGLHAAARHVPAQNFHSSQKVSIAFKAIKTLGDPAPFSALQSLEQRPACGSCTPIRVLFAHFAHFSLLLHTELRCPLFQEAFLDTTALQAGLRIPPLGLPVHN